MQASNDRVEAALGRLGSVIAGKWHLLRLIGVGGMGAVYEARHRNTRRVALKLLHRGRASSASDRKRFHRECHVANRIGHRGVPEVYDDDVDEDGSPFLVMELLSGRTVADLRRELGGVVPALRALSIAASLLEVLEAAHAKGILHRDVKPENLFVTDDGELKVLDFGIARIADRDWDVAATEDGTLLGTPAFAPPEQARGRIRELDDRSDVWSVGATLFTLLTGCVVHEADTPNELLAKAISSQAPSLRLRAPHFPKALIHLVDRALAYERADRWSSAAEMRAAVQWILEAWPELESHPDRVPAAWITSETSSTVTSIRSPKVPKAIPLVLLGLAIVGFMRWKGATAQEEPPARSATSTQHPAVAPATAMISSRAEDVRPGDDQLRSPATQTSLRPLESIPSRAKLVRSGAFRVESPAPATESTNTAVVISAREQILDRRH